MRWLFYREVLVVVVVVDFSMRSISAKTYGLLAKVLLDLLVRHCEWLSRLGKDDCNGNVMTAWVGLRD